MTTSPLPERAGRRCHNLLNVLHSTHYFSPDLERELAAVGVEDSRAAYFAVRAAAMGPVSAPVVTATFFTFRPTLVARHVPAVWETAAPAVVLAARTRAVDATLRRLLGEEAVAAKEVAEAAELALRAAEACTPVARPLYAAHAQLPVPEEPHLALWHAATLLREHRGDGHLAALLAAELDPLEALVSHTATGKGMAPQWALGTRGWQRADWDAAAERLRARGLLDGEGNLTDAGVALRRELEAETDRLDRAPYEHLGAAGVARLTELASDLAGRALAAGAFPAGMVGKG
ncbi:SCO6745 family protein [Streptomyces sp. enrichment culture]|uniref:SCO6745 family protein n=1 Tax=Streptomyces sp. enrichment culture TaxID=1795815 RepID=UPI003F57DF3A